MSSYYAFERLVYPDCSVDVLMQSLRGIDFKSLSCGCCFSAQIVSRCLMIFCNYVIDRNVQKFDAKFLCVCRSVCHAGNQPVRRGSDYTQSAAVKSVSGFLDSCESVYPFCNIAYASMYDFTGMSVKIEI